MEPDNPFDPQHRIWKVLPLRPRPQPLESFSSYMTRLAEVNGLRSISELATLAGGVRMTPLQWRSDYPAAAYQGLAQLTGYPQERWLNMTFFHLLQHFGRAMNPEAVHNFLAGSLAACLRYCPLCLAEHHPAYYSLLWRFLVLPGCLEHGVFLRDQCGHCGSSLPLLSRRPQLTRCSTCQGDLRTSEFSVYSDSDEDWTAWRTDDFQWLLTSEPEHELRAQPRLLGTRFRFLRRQQRLSDLEVARRLGRDTAVVGAMDFLNRTKQASLRDYIRYADLLGYSLRTVFDFSP